MPTAANGSGHQLVTNTCAVSGLNSSAPAAVPVPLLDALSRRALGREPRRHPAQQKVSAANGLALCPNLHRAFDRHLFWIDADYRVQVADEFREFSSPDYGIRRFHGLPLRLPQQRAWHFVVTLTTIRCAINHNLHKIHTNFCGVGIFTRPNATR